jgi:hypothetical protein
MSRAPAPPVVRPITLRLPTQAEKALAQALKQDALLHTYSIAQRVGIYPA